MGFDFSMGFVRQGGEGGGLDARKPEITACPQEEQSLGGFSPEPISAKEVRGGSGGEPRREKRGGKRAKGAWNPEFAFTTTPRPESGAFSLLPAMSLSGGTLEGQTPGGCAGGGGDVWLGSPRPQPAGGKAGTTVEPHSTAAREQLWSTV